MSEQEEESDELEAFREAYKDGLGTFLELLEALPDELLAPDPWSLGIDERTFEELSPEEIGVVQAAIHEAFGIDFVKPNTIVRSYESETHHEARSPGSIRINWGNKMGCWSR